MAQTLYYNGTILTMEDRCPQVEAVLTEDGRILETGTWEKVKERAGDKARRLDLQGRVMMPGFICLLYTSVRFVCAVLVCIIFMRARPPGFLPLDFPIL